MSHGLAGEAGPDAGSFAGSSTPKVRLLDVKKRFFVKGRPVDALMEVSVDIRGGEFFCIVGPSGCGKTTLLRILAGLERQTHGTIEMIRDPGSQRPLNSM